MHLNHPQPTADIDQPVLNDACALAWRGFGYWYWFIDGAPAARSR